jgi:hypothetical protein
VEAGRSGPARQGQGPRAGVHRRDHGRPDPGADGGARPDGA